MVLSRLYPFAKSSRRDISTGLLLAVFAAGAELAQPWPIKWLVDHVLGQHAPGVLARKWLSLVSNTPSAAAIMIGAAIVLIALVHKLTQLCSSLLLIRAGGRLVFELRCRAFDQLHRLSLAYHDRKKVGESLYRVAYDAHAAQTMLTGALVPMFTGGLLFLGVCLVMLRIDVLMTVITLSAAPFFVVVIQAFGRRIDSLSTGYHQAEEKLVASAQESISSIRAIQAFTMEAQSGVRFRDLARGSLLRQLNLFFTQLNFTASVGLAMALATALVALVGTSRVLSQQLQVGDVLVFLAYLGMLYQPVNALCQSTSVVQSASSQLRRVFEVIDSVPAVAERPRARELRSVRGEISFRDVSFGYESDQSVLRHINLEVAPGTALALVGRSGAGKTTLASLLTRFYDPLQGAILLDGVDLRDLKLDWLRRQVSVVLQDPILFATTLHENIAVGCPDATTEQIIAASRAAQLHEYVLQLPLGYETLLGERGVNLSGGQRQRLSIARALLKNAPILVLDEPTSALDVRTEENLLSALRELMKGRTTFIIAHRLSTVRLADRIAVMDQGEILEKGSHEELLERNGPYAEMSRVRAPTTDKKSNLVLQT